MMPIPEYGNPAAASIVDTQTLLNQSDALVQASHEDVKRVKLAVREAERTAAHTQEVIREAREVCWRGHSAETPTRG